MEKEKVTQGIVRELIHYDPRSGTMTWKPRSRKWFTDSNTWKRWNNRYAGQPAFTYCALGKRWGCMLGENYLAHRIAWMHAYGRWPARTHFVNGDATDLRLSNLRDVGYHPPQPRERIRLAA